MQNTIEMKFNRLVRFGKYHYYPGCQLSEAIKNIGLKKCLSERDIQLLEEVENVKLSFEDIDMTKQI